MCASKADDSPAEATAAAPASHWRELSFGATAMAHSWSVYSSTTIAPFGGLDADGVRLRAGGGYGKYRYDRPRTCYDKVMKVEISCPPDSINARVTFTDVLAGYQMSHGRFTAKAFVGIAIDTQALDPFDANNKSAGRDSGLKAVLETWTNITPEIWLSVDGALTQAHEQRAAQARLGYRLSPNLSIGLEDAIVRNIAGHQFRSGLFARYEWAGGEATVSGGVSGKHHDYPNPGNDDAWAALSVMFRY